MFSREMLVSGVGHLTISEVSHSNQIKHDQEPHKEVDPKILKNPGASCKKVGVHKKVVQAIFHAHVGIYQT